MKTAFLNENIEDEDGIYVVSPRGLQLGLPEGYLLKPRKALYGLKRAPRICNETFYRAVRKAGFEEVSSDDCCYFHRNTRNSVHVLIYVDDLRVIGYDPEVISVNKMLMDMFKKSDI